MAKELPEKWQQVAPGAAPADPLPGGEVLQHSAGPWTIAALVASDLQVSMDAGLARLASSHEGVAAGARGLATAIALDGVKASWEERIKAVRGECSGLSAILKGVAQAQGELDGAIGRQFRRIEHRKEG
ncbi:hypothetical protein [Streptomyces sp. NPDC051183]|uniref:hypothetical protein n=1 Tax=Streptomyces sp. NPDC051183 TaxID=3155165 RepID=UPI0034205434